MDPVPQQSAFMLAWGATCGRLLSDSRLGIPIREIGDIAHKSTLRSKKLAERRKMGWNRERCVEKKNRYPPHRSWSGMLAGAGMRAVYNYAASNLICRTYLVERNRVMRISFVHGFCGSDFFQHLELFLDQLGQQHLSCFFRTVGQQHLDCF
jgi:hypothetical protein